MTLSRTVQTATDPAKPPKPSNAFRAWGLAWRGARKSLRDAQQLREMPRERLEDMGIAPQVPAVDVADLPQILIPGRLW